MYTSAPRVGDLRRSGRHTYNPSWNQYSWYPDYNARRWPVNEKWNWHSYTGHGLDWYQTYENSWDYGDNRGHGFQSYPNIYATPGYSFSSQRDDIEPHRWWYEDKQYQVPLESRCSSHPEHNIANEFFRPAGYEYQGRTLNNRPPESAAPSHLADKTPPSSVETSSLSTPFPEASTEDWSRSQSGILPDTCVGSGNRVDLLFTPRVSSLGTHTALQKCVQDLKRERLHLRRERRSLNQLNSQLRSMLCSFKTAANRRREDGCQCPTGRQKGKNAGHGGRATRASEQCYHCRASGDPRNVSPDRLSSTGIVNGAGEPTLERYNAAWNALKTADNDRTFAFKGGPEIPWPTRDLQYASFVCYEFYDQRCSDMSCHLPFEIAHNPFQLQKWQAFCFFVEAFGFNPYYDFVLVDECSGTTSCDRSRWRINIDEDQERLIFRIGLVSKNVSTSRQQLEALKAQMQREKLRWHPDRWGAPMRQAVGTLEENKLESAKAVWGAVVDVSQACDAHLRGLRERYVPTLATIV